METTSLFSLLDKANHLNVLREKITIAYFLNSNEIPIEKLKKETVNQTYLIVEIPLSEKESVIIEDRPQNFFLAHTILLGEKTKLYSAKHKFSEKTFYFQDTIKEKISKHILTNTIQKTNPQILSKKEIKPQFKQIPILKELVKYIKEKKDLNLNAIHITKSHNLELFLPTIRKKHLRIAKNMHIPIQSLIENNFFKDLTININDEKTITKHLKPIESSIKKIQINKTFENQIPYKDITEHMLIGYDIKKIEKQLIECKHTNFDIYSIISILKQKKEIIFGIKNKNQIPLPVWRKDKLITFNSTEKFKEFSGINYKSNFKILNETYLQNESGKQINFKNSALNPKLENTLKTIPENKTITFETAKDLVLNLILEENPQTIIKKEIVNQNKIIQLLKRLTKLCEILILTSISYNQTPKENEKETTLETYLESKIKTIENINLEYEKNPNKNKLINKTLDETKEIIKIFKLIPITNHDLFNIQGIINLLSEITIKFEKEKTKEILNQTSQIIKLKEINSVNFKQDKGIENYFDSLPSITKKIKQHKNFKILIKKEFPTKHLSKIEKIENNSLLFIGIKPNIEEIKKIAPYSYIKISNFLRKSKIIPKTIPINGKYIPNNKEYYSKYYKLKNYKLKQSNTYFDLYEN